MFSSKQTWQNESVSFSVPSLQTLQTLSSSRSMLTNCSSFIVPWRGRGRDGTDKGRDRYSNRHPAGAPAASAPGAAAGSTTRRPQPGLRPPPTHPAPARPDRRGTREGGRERPGKVSPSERGAGSGQAARWGRGRGRRGPRPPAASPPAHPFPPPQAAPYRPAPPQAPHPTLLRAPAAQTLCHRQKYPSPAHRRAAPYHTAPCRRRPPQRRSPLLFGGQRLRRRSSAPGTARRFRPRPRLLRDGGERGDGGRTPWSRAPPRLDGWRRLRATRRRAARREERAASAACPPLPAATADGSAPAPRQQLGSPRARRRCLPRAGERGRGRGWVGKPARRRRSHTHPAARRGVFAPPFALRPAPRPAPPRGCGRAGCSSLVWGLILQLWQRTVTCN